MSSFIIVFGNIHLILDPVSSFLMVFVFSWPGEGCVATCDCRWTKIRQLFPLAFEILNIFSIFFLTIQ